jgi:hypothetical protein
MPPECSSVVGDRWHQPRRAGRPRAIRATDGGQSDVDGPQPGRGQQGDVRQHASRQQIGTLDPAAGASRSPSLVQIPTVHMPRSIDGPGRTAACHHSAAAGPTINVYPLWRLGSRVVGGPTGSVPAAGAGSAGGGGNTVRAHCSGVHRGVPGGGHRLAVAPALNDRCRSGIEGWLLGPAFRSWSRGRQRLTRTLRAPVAAASPKVS